MSDTKIRWTNATWNPVTGCSRVSPGCEHCYAEALSLRFGWSKKPWTARNAAENVILHPERLNVPKTWRKPKRVFVNSMSDLFHEQVPESFIDQVFDVMAACPGHTFQVLTKRPERMQAYMLGRLQREGIQRNYTFDDPVQWNGWQAQMWAERHFPNVWLGTSVEDQRRAIERISVLMETPAAVRFLSCEPLLGPVDLFPFLMWESPSKPPRIHWVIVGGESGPHYRPMDPEWARTIRDQCINSSVAFFFKQSSGPRTEMGTELEGRMWEQFPDTGSQQSELLAGTR